MARKSTKLKEVSKLLKSNGKLIVENVEPSTFNELKKEMWKIHDKRDQSYVKHNLVDIIMLVLIAVLANADEWVEIEKFGKQKYEWLKKFLELPNGIPSHDTIQRVFSKLSSKQLHNTCINFLKGKLDKLFDISKDSSNEEIELKTDIVSLDGKTSCGSGRKETLKNEIKPMHTLNMYSEGYGMCLEQIVVQEKTNEITASKQILKLIDISGSIVTCDALNTQRKVVEEVISRGANYVFALKGNQHNFYKDVVDYFDCKDFRDKIKKSKMCKKTVSKENSNIVTRIHYLEEDIKWLSCKGDWKGIKAIGLVHKIIEKANGEKSEEKRYYICSITDIEDFESASRGHWCVENNLHWHLDYTFKDDNNTTAEKNSAKNLQIIKKVALALLNIAKPAYKTSLKNMRKIIGWNFEVQIENIFKLLNTEDISKLLIK